MKRSAFILALHLFVCLKAGSQTVKEAADGILKKEIALLQQMPGISYSQIRETTYYGEGYHNRFESRLYFDFTETDNPVGFRFQGVSKDYSTIFNGTRLLTINEQKQTIDTATIRTDRDIQHSSYLYHSIAMLRNFIPAVLANDSILRSVSDTLIGQQPYYNVRINCPERMYFQIFKGVLYMTNPGSYMQYHLIIDQKTLLPYIFLQKYIRSATDDRDFVMTTYAGIDTQPARPLASSWKYDSYIGKYQPYIAPVKKAIVKPGDTIADFKLPQLTVSGVDSVSFNRYAGKVVLLDFWFRSCGPCMAAMPKYNELQASFPKDRFTLVTVNIEDNEEEVRFFYKKFRPNYPMLINGGKVFTKLGFTGCPSAVLIDGKGKVVRTFFGFDEAEIRSGVNALVGK